MQHLLGASPAADEYPRRAGVLQGVYRSVAQPQAYMSKHQPAARARRPEAAGDGPHSGRGAGERGWGDGFGALDWRAAVVVSIYIRLLSHLDLSDLAAAVGFGDITRVRARLVRASAPQPASSARRSSRTCAAA